MPRPSALPSGRTRLLAIFGWPLSYTRSPRMQNAALRHRGLDVHYAALAAPDAKAFRALFKGLSASPHFVGANVTNPFKTEALHLAQTLSPAARAIGAVNTLVRGPRGWAGHNTDAAGFLAALRRQGLSLKGRRVLLLGAGGAARALAWACGQARVGSLLVLARRRSPASACAALAGRAGMAGPLEADAAAIAAIGADLVINSLPGEKLGQTFGRTIFKKTKVPGWALDIATLPQQSAFCRAAARRGWRWHNGEEMLLQQGALSFKLWTGRSPDLAVMRAALRKV